MIRQEYGYCQSIMKVIQERLRRAGSSPRRVHACHRESGEFPPKGGETYVWSREDPRLSCFNVRLITSNPNGSGSTSPPTHAAFAVRRGHSGRLMGELRSRSREVSLYASLPL